jgi:Zn-dependent protease
MPSAAASTRPPTPTGPGSVLVHELAHAFVSQARGIRVQDITLSLFGGATRARVESRGPGDEFLIALVGPLTSGLLAALFGITAGLGRDELSAPLAGTLGYLAWTNLVLARFNLVPGFPLDGGRLLRSAIWKATGSLARATRIASAAGQGVGWLLVAAGSSPSWPGTWPGGSGSPSSAGSWSRPPAPPTRSSSCSSCCAGWRPRR